MKKENIDDKVEETTPATEEKAPVEKAPEETEQDDNNTPEKRNKGIVFNCLVLNVRRTPEINGPIETTIPKWAEVEINESESTEEYYSVVTKDGTTGFCMKSFIKL